MRLLLLEDQRSLADAIATHFRAEGFVVDVVNTINDARLALKLGDIDIALFDLALPDGDGLILLKEIRAQGSRLPVLIMTARDQISDRVLGLEAGADDYLVKPCDLKEMRARVQAVIRRYNGNPNPMLTMGDYSIDCNNHRILINGVDAQLTAKEWALVEKLVSKPKAIVSKPHLEEALYGFDDEVVSNTLEVYISRIRKKLGKHAIETIRGLGYRFSGE